MVSTRKNYLNKKQKDCGSGPLGSESFDEWAPSYDDSVAESEAESRYPFAGYTEVLAEVMSQVKHCPGSRVLDLGFGTGVLTQRLYAAGYEITGLDFSAEMIAMAKEKMPTAKLLQYDFIKGLPAEISAQNFDAIISTYAIHHLNDGQQKQMLMTLLNMLNKGGRIIIGDVATATRAEMARAYKKDRELWDTEEFYLIAEEVNKYFPCEFLDFITKSYCSGVLVLAKR